MNIKIPAFYLLLLGVALFIPTLEVKAQVTGDTGFGWLSIVSEVVGDDSTCGPNRIRQELYLRDRNSNLPITVNSATFKVYNRSNGVMTDSVTGAGPNVGTVCWNPDTQFIDVKVSDTLNPDYYDFNASFKTEKPTEFPREKHMRTTAYLVSKHSPQSFEYKHNYPVGETIKTNPQFKIDLTSLPNTYGATQAAEVTLFVRSYNPSTGSLGDYVIDGAVYQVSGTGEITLPQVTLPDGMYSWAFYIKLNGGHNAGGFVQEKELMSGHSKYSLPFTIDTTAPTFTYEPHTHPIESEDIFVGTPLEFDIQLSDEVSGVSTISVFVNGIMIETCTYADVDVATCVPEYPTLTAGDYTYSVKATDSLGNEFISPIYNYTVHPPKVPEVYVNKPWYTNDNGATVEVGVFPFYSSADVSIVYGTVPPTTCADLVGTTIHYGPVSNSTMWQLEANFIEYELTGLVPNTVYYYCAYATNGNGKGWSSNVESFRTVALPDFWVTWGGVMPDYAILGATTTFTFETDNAGMADSPSANAYFKLEKHSNSVSVDLLPVKTIPPMPARTENEPVSIDYQFTETGWYTMIGCADQSSSGDIGTVTESDEDNNCTNWWGGQIEVIDALAPQTMPGATTVGSFSVNAFDAEIYGQMDPGIEYVEEAHGFFRYDTTSAPTCELLAGVDVEASSPGWGGWSNVDADTEVLLVDLLPDTTYYYCAYTENSVGTAYGEVMSFTTLKFIDIAETSPYATGTIPVPTGLTATPSTCSTNMINVNWNDQFGIETFDLKVNGVVIEDIFESVYSGSPFKPYEYLAPVPGDSYTFQVRATYGANASAWTPLITAEAPALCLGGNIVANSCTIASGNSTCSTSVVWDSQSFIGNPEISQGSDVFSSSPASLGTSRQISPLDNVFTLRDTGGTFSTSFTAIVNCDASSSWVMVAGVGTCLPKPVININVTPEVIRSGKTAIIEAEVSSIYDLECTIKDGGPLRTIIHTGSALPQTSIMSTRPLTSAQIVTIDCGAILYPTLRNSNQVRVRVVPTYQEV